MSDELLPPVAADQLRISVEVGDEYEPSDRVAAALRELHDALAAESETDSDVEGFYSWTLTDVKVTSYSFDSAGALGAQSFLQNKADSLVNKASPLLYYK